jgi:predicted outer membrane repeat protein
MRTQFLITLLVISFSTISFATTINVPDDQPTIQAGLNIAAEGDTVLVAAGTYFENITWPAVNGIKLIGSGEEGCIIDGNSLASVIRFTWALGGIIDETTRISGFTIQNGNAGGESPDNRGGGIRCSFASPSLHDLIIADNFASYRGGGIYCETNSTTSIVDVTISGNMAGSGGGIYFASNSNSVLENVIVSSNSASEDGGGLYFDTSSPGLTDVSVSDNQAESNGGGMMISYSNPDLTGVIITGNSAMLGGGIYGTGSTPALTGVRLTDNSAGCNGGGIYCDQNSSLNFSTDNRCNLFSNKISQGRGFGADLFSVECDIIDLVVDTFTVMTPTSYHASPIEGFSFDIQHSSYELIDADVYVAVDGDDSNDGTSPEAPFKTIQHALSRIADNHTIHLAAGVYSPSTTGESFPIDWSDNVNVAGAGVGESVLDAELLTRVIEFEFIENAIIENLTITNGAANLGGGIYCHYSNPSFLHLEITCCSADREGGGMYCNSSSPDLSDVALINNTSFGRGGGLHCEQDSNPNLTNVSFNGNFADSRGGGMCCFGSSPVLQDVTFRGNVSDFAGGGLCIDDYSDAILIDVFVDDNTAASHGGGLYIYRSDATLSNLTISNNSAHLYGGGIYFHESTSSLEEVTISENTVWWAGGGIYCFLSEITLSRTDLCDNYSFENGGGVYSVGSSMQIVDVLFEGNEAWTNGGGISCTDSPELNFENVTFSDNTAQAGGGISCGQGTNLGVEGCILWNNIPQQVVLSTIHYPSSITVSCSDIEGGEAGIITDDNSEVHWLENNIDEDPMFCEPDSSDYRLQLESSCRTDVCGFMGYTGETCDGEVVGAAPRGCPAEFYLAQNYPNPFNPTTTIEYGLTEPCFVELYVYNINGQLVDVIQNDFLHAGHHSLDWMPNDLPSGIYFVELKAGEFRDVMKVSFVK